MMNHFFDSGAGYVLRLTFLCAVVFCAGRAALDLMLSISSSDSNTKSVLRNEGFVALAFGPVVVLLLTWILTVLHLYGYLSLLGSLLLFIVIVAATNSRFRGFVRRPWSELGSTLPAYVAGVATLWILFDVSEYPARKAAALYLLQGIDLSLGLGGTQWPNFGVMIPTPILYTGHLITSISALLSHDNHFAFYVVGLYWLNVLVAPAVPIGAYLLFRRFLPTIFAIAAAGAFCASTLDVKIWSLRGESIGWIIGFAFLIVFIDILTALTGGGAKHFWLRFVPVAALLFFGVMLTHAIAAVVAAFAAAGTGCLLLESRRRSDALALVQFACSTALLSVALLGLFEYSYAGTSLIESNRLPPAGDRDAAMQFENATTGFPINADVPLVRAHPPYVPLQTIAQVAAFLPPASLANVDALRDFPGELTERLGTLSEAQRALYVLAPLILVIVFITPLRRRPSPGRRLFLISLMVYICLVASVVYLDFKSVSLYPLAAAHRTFVYIAFFYWLAIGAAIVDLLSVAFRSPLGSICARIPYASHVASAKASAILLVCFTITFFIYSVTPYLSGPVTPLFLLQHIAQRLTAPLGSSAVIRKLEPMFEALAFIRDHAQDGEWVYSNVTSYDNSFLFLTSGRRSLLEGTSIYQLYFVQREAAVRIERYAEFAATSDPALLSPPSVRYVMLYRGSKCSATCYGSDLFPANLSLFGGNSAFRKLFVNSDYEIFELTARPQTARMRLIERFLPVCKSGDLAPRTVIAACSKLIPALRGFAASELPPLLVTRGLAYRQQGDPNRALSDFRAAVGLAPGDLPAVRALAETYMAIGDVGQAIDASTRAIAVDDSAYELYILRGRVEMQSRHYADAIRDFSSALRWGPGDAEARLQRASAYAAAGRLLEAAGDLTQLEQDFQYRRQAAAALADLKRHLSFPLQPALDAFRGCTGSGSPTSRISECTTLLGIIPHGESNEISSILVRRGDIFDELDEVEQARGDFHAALEIDPHNAAAFAGLAAVDLKAGNRRQALLDYGKAISFDDHSPDLRYLRGSLRYAMGDTDGAIDDFDATLRLDQGYAAAYYRRAISYEVRREPARAASDLKAALLYNPNLTEAAAELKALQTKGSR